MENRNKFIGINRKTVIVFHRIILVAMLHSTLVAPCQSMIQYAYGSHKIYFKNYATTNSELLDSKINIKKNTSSINSVSEKYSKNVNLIPTKNKLNNFHIDSDIKEGVIGVSNTNPLDDVKDNLFKFYIKDLPNKNIKAYLTYELFGVQDYDGVSRSINDRPATGGYLVKNQMGWTTQKEEINLNWLHTGENKIMFSIPKGANYQ